MASKKTGDKWLRVLMFLVVIFAAFITFRYVKLTEFNNSTGSKTLSLPKQEAVFCSRKNPYPMAPEFERALSLIMQRQKQNLTTGISQALDLVRNCLSIEYTDTGEGEGYFVFDSSNVKRDYLPIYVNNKYQYTDDLSTSLLLMHEIAHVFQYYREVFLKEDAEDCYTKEINAFYNQYLYMGLLNSEELRTITSKWGNNVLSADSNSQIQITKQLSIFGYEATKACNLTRVDMANTCWNAKFSQFIGDVVKSNPYYQKQCAGN